MTVPQALSIAREKGLDLVEVAPSANPPVCRILDFGKFRFDQNKKEKESRKHQKLSSVREVRIRPMVSEHDLQVKIKTAEKLLEDDEKVKISVVFRGREMTHPDIGAALLRRIAEHLKDKAVLESSPAMEGRMMGMLVAPLPVQVKKQAQTPAVKKPVGTPTTNAAPAAPAQRPGITVGEKSAKA